MIYGKKVYGLITAAGSGSRMEMDQTKQLLKIGNKTVIERTFSKLQACPYIDKIRIVAKADEINQLIKIFENKDKYLDVIEGGSSREESTFNGIRTLDSDSIVLLHDGSRPFVKVRYLNQALELMDREEGVILGTKVKDTIKVLADDNYIAKTLDRSKLINVQTPQVFKTKTIQRAYALAGGNYGSTTDDSQLIENLGLKVFVIEGDYDNIKITTQEDLNLSKILAQEEDNEDR